MLRLFFVVLGVLASVFHPSSGFYLPGVAPREFQRHEQVGLKVNKLTSSRTHLGYSYYDLAFCQPAGGPQRAAENLGEHLLGENIQNSPYELFMQKNETCKILCTKTLTHGQVDDFVTKIRLEYNVHWIIDNLPAAAVGLTQDESKLYARGFPVGETLVDTGDVFLFNHARITVYYHTSDDYEGARIVGFEVRPMSILHHIVDDEEGTARLSQCDRRQGFKPEDSYPRLMLTGPKAQQEITVTWSYDVFWVPSQTEWANRWDIYLSMGDRYGHEIHWFSIVNSIVIAVFLTGLVAMIMVRTLFKDIGEYNRVPTDDEEADDLREETGWKLVHADVFRPPSRAPQLFAITAGTGVQLMGMSFFTILFSALGFFSPAARGSLIIGLLVLFLLMGSTAGYVAARTHKMFNGKQWQRTTLLTAFLFPGIIFGVLFILNLFIWGTGSVNAVPFGSMASVMALWFLVSVPLVFLGAYYGFRQDAVEFPCRVGRTPRGVPPQPWYFALPLTMAVGGILPFGAVFVEMFFILTAIWQEQYYYVFGFLLLVYILLAITCAEVSIVLTYFQLCSQDYRWWWRSWLVPGAAGAYMFMYSMLYYFTQLDMTQGVPTLLYVGYMMLASFLFSILCGAMGYIPTFWFVRKIYGAVKVE